MAIDNSSSSPLLQPTELNPLGLPSRKSLQDEQAKADFLAALEEADIDLPQETLDKLLKPIAQSQTAPMPTELTIPSTQRPGFLPPDFKSAPRLG